MRRNYRNGFTLIELIVVFSILVILSTVGIVAFVNYSHIQALNTAASDVVTMLQTAKSRAQSQVKPVASGVCSGSSAPALTGYQMTICPNGCTSSIQKYELGVLCGSSDQSIEVKNLPQNIAFANSMETSFIFRLLTGGVEGAAFTGTPIVVNGYSQTKIITVYSDGRIVSQ